MPDLSYDVVAMSFPIVYTVDGDHDPNGLLFTLRAYEPLLEWARARWEDEDEYLPRTHRQQQLIQIVIDGLDRYETMRGIVRHGPDHHRHLLGDFGELERAEEADSGENRLDPRSRAVRQNYRATVDELAHALAELTDGAIRAVDPDAEVRQAWRKEWQAALESTTRAIAAWFDRLEADSTRRFDAEALAQLSGLTPARVRRLLLNDHRGFVQGLVWQRPRTTGSTRSGRSRSCARWSCAPPPARRCRWFWRIRYAPAGSGCTSRATASAGSVGGG